jgi:hypothetical protein
MSQNRPDAAEVAKWMAGPQRQILQRRIKESIAACARQDLQDESSLPDDVKRRRATYEAAMQRREEIMKEAGYDTRRAEKHADYAETQRLLDEADVHAEPPPLGQQLRTLPGPTGPFWELDDASRVRLVDQVARERATRLAAAGGAPFQGTGLDGGRILAFLPGETLVDGAAEYESCGFFDAGNTPPWDVWIGYHNGVLVSWVPPKLLALADAGVNVNPEECLFWID